MLDQLPDLCQWLRSEIGLDPKPESIRSVSGGDINEAYWIDTGQGVPIFLKANAPHQLELFRAEAKGLDLLRSTGTIRIPEVLTTGLAAGKAILALEAIELHSSLQPADQTRLGHQLAEMHLRSTSLDGSFGLHFDNHIGRTPQPNGLHQDWWCFFAEIRIGYQIDLARERGWRINERSDLIATIKERFSHISVCPALLHGDLWGGNYGFDPSGNPVLYDPAPYYGHAEADIAFTHMFGGFGPDFYQTYRDQHPADSKVDQLHNLYNLYHTLNHYNLFGGSYRPQSQSVIQKLLKQT